MPCKYRRNVKVITALNEFYPVLSTIISLALFGDSLRFFIDFHQVLFLVSFAILRLVGRVSGHLNVKFILNSSEISRSIFRESFRIVEIF